MIPEHVLSAFQLEGRGTPTSPAWDNGLRFGHVVVARATQTAAWSGKVRDKLGDSLGGVRFARPVRSTDGRLVVNGFCANEFAPGEPAARVDEAIAAALLIDAPLTQFNAPPAPRDDAWAEADRAAWRGFDLDPAENQLVTAHIDFLACCLFSGTEAPVVTELVPSVNPRPRGYTAALTMVDGLLAGAVDDGVVSRWAHIPDVGFLAERALEFREIAARTAGANIGSRVSWVREVLVSA